MKALGSWLRYSVLRNYPEQFLRSVAKPSKTPVGKWFACRPDKDLGLSFFARDKELADDAQLENLRAEYQLPSGALAALWLITAEDFSAVNLDPFYKKGTGKYRHLHFETSCPGEKERELLALRLAAEKESRLLLVFKKKPKKKKTEG